MYRPDDWDEIIGKIRERTYYNPLGEIQLVEAGADAMLEALIEQGRFNHAGYGTTDFPDARWGWFVFIPES